MTLDYFQQEHIEEFGNEILGREFNVFGYTIDEKESLENLPRRSIHRPFLPMYLHSAKKDLATGIKAIDLLSPIEKGGKAGMFGGAGVGKTVLIMEMIHNMATWQKGVSFFCKSEYVKQKSFTVKYNCRAF